MTGLNDTLLTGFMRAYERDAKYQAAEFDRELHSAAYYLLKLGIIVMADFLA